MNREEMEELARGVSGVVSPVFELLNCLIHLLIKKDVLQQADIEFVVQFMEVFAEEHGDEGAERPMFDAIIERLRGFSPAS